MGSKKITIGYLPQSTGSATWNYIINRFILDRAKDDYSANRQLRDAMRLKRKASKSVEISNSGN